MVRTEKGKTYRAGAPGLTQFDPIKNTVGNRPGAVVRGRSTGATANLKKGDTVRSTGTSKPKRKDEPTLPRREYTQGT